MNKAPVPPQPPRGIISPPPPPPPPPGKGRGSAEACQQIVLPPLTSEKQPNSSKAAHKTSLNLSSHDIVYDDSHEGTEDFNKDEDFCDNDLEENNPLDDSDVYDSEDTVTKRLKSTKLDFQSLYVSSSEEKSVYFEPLNPAEAKYMIEKQLEDTHVIIIKQMKSMASTVLDFQQQCEQYTINDCFNSIGNCQLHKQSLISHDHDWLDIAKAYPTELTWQDLRHVLEVRSSCLLRGVTGGPTTTAKKERDDLLIKIERELSQPRKLSEQKNLDAAIHGLTEYFQQGEHLFLHRIAGYDEAVHDFLLKVPAMITSAQEEVHREFQVTDLIHGELQVAYQQQVSNLLCAQQLQREHQQLNETLKQKLVKEATMDFGLQRQKEIIDRYQHDNNHDAASFIGNFRQEQLDIVDEAILQSYERIYQRLQDASQYIAQENMHERLNTIRHAILLWKQQYAKGLEDRLNSIELVTEGYYITLIEELMEQVMDLRKLHTLGDIYCQKLAAYLSSLKFKDSKKSLPEDDAKALAMLHAFPSKYSSSYVQSSNDNIVNSNKQQQQQSTKSILGLGTSLRCLAANANVSAEETAQLLTYLLISGCQP